LRLKTFSTPEQAIYKNIKIQQINKNSSFHLVFYFSIHFFYLTDFSDMSLAQALNSSRDIVSARSLKAPYSIFQTCFALSQILLYPQSLPGYNTVKSFNAKSYCKTVPV
jgi:hypothetical protein